MMWLKLFIAFRGTGVDGLNPAVKRSVGNGYLVRL